MDPTKDYKGPVLTQFIASAISFTFFMLFVNKLEDSTAYTAFVILIPLFIIAGCTCCMFSCVICTMSEEMFEEEDLDSGQYHDVESGEGNGNGDSVSKEAKSSSEASDAATSTSNVSPTEVNLVQEDDTFDDLD